MNGAASAIRRPLLEFPRDVGKTQPVQEGRQLVELLHTLREILLDQLLAHTTRIRVVRRTDLLERDLPLAATPAPRGQRIGWRKRWVRYQIRRAA